MQKYINIQLPLQGDEVGNKKDLYYRILQLSECKYGCIQNNSTFAEELNVTSRTIQRWLVQLIAANKITTNGKRNGNRVLAPSTSTDFSPVTVNNEEIIAVEEPMPEPDNEVKVVTVQKVEPEQNSIVVAEPVEMVKVTRIKRFVKPTVEEISAYCRQPHPDRESRMAIDAEYFYRYYEARDWRRGKEKMKSWRLCIATWALNNKNNKNNGYKSNKTKNTFFNMDIQI